MITKIFQFVSKIIFLLSTKLFSVFFLLSLVFWGYGFYYYFFVVSKGNITLQTNIDNYTVSLYNSKLKTNFSTVCQNKLCELIDIAPFSYELTIRKEGFKEYKTNILLTKNDTLVLEAFLEKQLLLEKQTPQIKEEVLSTQEQIDKIREITLLQKNYKYIDIPQVWFFYFTQKADGNLDLFQKIDTENRYLLSLPKKEKKDLNILKVFQSNDLIAIIHGEDVYVYDLIRFTMEKIFFPQKIHYIKQEGTFFHFINEKWTFLYDTKNKKIEYFYFFRDFLYFDEEHYLWVIFQDEKEKKRNFWLSESSGNLIVKYNFRTKDIQILETTSLSLSKIVKERGQIYFYDQSENKYLVKNIQ